MRSFKAPGKSVVRLLCVLVVFFLLSGSALPDEQQTPVAESTAGETVDITETSETVEIPEETALQEEIPSQQEDSKRLITGLTVTSGVFLVLAIWFLMLWRRTAAKLRNAKKRNSRPAADHRIHQVRIGKIHGIGCRSSQQDSFSVFPEDSYGSNGILAMVADGMGGLENGDKASQAAVTAAMGCFYEAGGTGGEKLLQILRVAKEAVDAVRAESGYTECGTTLAMGMIQDGCFYSVSVGDSRICLYRRGSLIQLNREHAYLYDQIRQAVNEGTNIHDAYTGDQRGCITSFLGMGSIRHIDIPATPLPVLPKDKIILMSDGVYNALSQEELCLALQHPAQDAADAIESFIHTRNFPDQDNYTAVILECL